MRMLSLYSIKGGVGKTASAVNLASEAAGSGLRVLLWDLDPQAATTFYLKVKPKIRGGVEKLVKGKAAFNKVIRATNVDGLDVLPASLDSREMDHLLEHQGTSHLRQILARVRDEYDLVILDCPPTLSHMSENMFTSVDALLVPVVPSTLSLRTLEQLETFLDDRHLTCPLWPFLTLADRRRSLHREVIDSFDKRWPLRLSTVIPAASAVERMGLERAPVRHFAPASPAAHAYAGLWKEVSQRLK
ncbi:ParA family protein [Halomonas denitrificans]|uniref:ParA family protein n=1 Tax=Halomonas TaxID=2745 RepID=UPI001C966E5E|nr:MULTISPECIES: ParA family protein [Halomonas]MBY5930687.1 ParA family protein [Halomonas sp. DP8Y7-3]MBY6030573.1 ParA family protein [Halomonas sp. DP8Y7-1]MBY6207932.1 ParA family protein [Halomonas sp. DP3Y7-2]MBY6228741.1 ParA family protein [Halomonas sp. DP3Y7-1]MCA0917275.1 ParA family protein [Halomonas denitrificans]